MNILFAVKSYWPSSGGVQSVTKYMAEGLARRGHNVTILTSFTSETPVEEQHNNVTIHRIKARAFLKFNYGGESDFQNYILSRTDLDIVITVCAQSFAAKWLFPIIDKVKAKKVMYMHGMRGEHIDFSKIYSLSNFFKEFLLTTWWNIYFKRYWSKIIKYDACVHLYENDCSFRYFEAHGFKNNVAIANSCDETFFEPSKDSTVMQRYGINKPYFIQVANYDENKNQMFSLKAYLNSGLKEVEIVFVGSRNGSYVNKVEKYCDQLPDHMRCRIHILKSVPRQDTIELVKNSYATLLSSHSEYFPISIIEGMAAGKPFISTYVGEVPKMVGGHTVKTIPDMAYWMRYYFDNKDYVIRCGELGFLFAKEHMLLDSKIAQLESLCSNN